MFYVCVRGAGCHPAVCFQSRRPKFGPRRANSSRGGILQKSRAISPRRIRVPAMFRIHSSLRELFANGRESDIPAERRCAVGDLIGTGCTEGEIGANRGRVVSQCKNQLHCVLVSVTRRAWKPVLNVGSQCEVKRLPVLD